MQNASKNQPMQTRFLFPDKKLLVAALLYFLAGGIILFWFGIQLGGEAEKYIDNANRIINGQELRNGVFGFFYLAYSLVVAVFIKLQVNLVFVGLLQLFLSFVAALALYKVACHTFGDKRLAFFLFCAYLLCYPIQKWNFFLFSESLHTSLLVIGIYFLQRVTRHASVSAWAVFIFSLALIVFSRPVGVVFLLAATMALAGWYLAQSQRKVALLFVFLGIAVVIGMVCSPLASFVNPDSIKRMEVICQVPEKDPGSAYTEFNRAGLYQSFRVVNEEVGWGNFIRAGLRKLGSFYGIYRPYYSWANNGLLLIYLLFYPLALIGIFSRLKGPFGLLKGLSVSYLLLTSVAIFFTCDDWANRFISPAFPFILILAAGGAKRIYDWSGRVSVRS